MINPLKTNRSNQAQLIFTPNGRFDVDWIKSKFQKMSTACLSEVARIRLVKSSHHPKRSGTPVIGSGLQNSIEKVDLPKSKWLGQFMIVKVFCFLVQEASRTLPASRPRSCGNGSRTRGLSSGCSSRSST